MSAPERLRLIVYVVLRDRLRPLPAEQPGLDDPLTKENGWPSVRIQKGSACLGKRTKELGNIKKACHIIGYSRQQFYEIRRNYQVYGAEGLGRPPAGACGWVQILNNDVLPFFERHRTKIATILSDNGREFCGRPDAHPYERFLQLEEIEHRTTKVRRPQSNGFIERFHRTLLEEHLRIQRRAKWYASPDEMQKDLDVYLAHYNTKRPHQGRGMNGRTPYQAFKEGISRKRKPAAKRNTPKKEVKKAA